MSIYLDFWRVYCVFKMEHKDTFIAKCLMKHKLKDTQTMLFFI